MPRITLTAEQAHGLVEAAYRGRSGDFNWAIHKTEALCELGYDAVFVIDTGAELQMKRGAKTKSVCSIWTGKARRYLTEQGLMQKEDGDEHA